MHTETLEGKPEAPESPAPPKAPHPFTLAWFGRNVRAVREYRGITQEQLALETGWSLYALRKLEAGFGNPDFREILRLSEWISISWWDLFCAIGKEPFAASRNGEEYTLARFGLNVKAARERMKRSQETLAKTATWSLSELQKAENGLGNPGYSELVRLGHALNTHWSLLFSQNPARNPAD